MKKYYISRNYKATSSAASKPKMDCEVIMSSHGFENLGFKQTNHPSSALGAIVNFFGITKGLIRLPFRSVFCMQYPLSKFFGYVTKVAKIKGCKIIMVVHDVKTLMGKTNDIAKEMEKFNKADVLILHNQAMIDWFLRNGYKGKCVPLYLFDYLPKGALPPLKSTNSSNSVLFAGGLGMEKSAFLYEVDKMEKKRFSLKLFGTGYKDKLIDQNTTILDYVGRFSPDQVLNHLKGDFGLVWNGNSVTECAGDFGRYLLYNNPHKTSLYILAGLPLVIWKDAEMAKLVEKEKIGITVRSLEELSDKIAAITEEGYANMIQNVERVRDQISTGGYLKKALEKALLLMNSS